ncbi:GerMN domain-containing protein [bacterium]|nr:GerMN domain-containing protein [bacterium]
MTSGVRLDRLSPWVMFAMFAAAVAVFVGTLFLLGWWIREPGPSEAGRARLAYDDVLYLSNADQNPLAERIRLARETLEKRQVRVFFTADGVRLRPQMLVLGEILEPHQRLSVVLRELLNGPASEYLVSTLPDGVELRGSYIWEKIAVVDFSSELRERRGGPMAELLCVYAIVNTVLENVDGVEAVRILVEGEPVPVLWDQVDLTAALNEDVSLIR